MRRAAQAMLQEALEREVEEFRQRVSYQPSAAQEGFRGYRNGYARERTVSVGSGDSGAVAEDWHTKRLDSLQIV